MSDDDLTDLVDEQATLEDPALEDRLLTDDLEDRVVEGAEPDASAGMLHVVEPVYSQPVNRATMECLRGPCLYYWPLTARFVAPGKRISLKRIRTCVVHSEETNLGGQNVYHCGQWWPAFLAWVPVSLRPVLRPRLRTVYESYLRKQGYDFSWKNWPDSQFESDAPQYRDDSGPGGKRPSRPLID